MANKEHVALLKDGAEAWNEWWNANPDVVPDLRGADLSRAMLDETVFGDTNLTRAKGLEICFHTGPSTIDHRTLQRSGPLPLTFLRGIGLPDNLIDYLPSLLNQPIQF